MTSVLVVGNIQLHKQANNIGTIMAIVFRLCKKDTGRGVYRGKHKIGSSIDGDGGAEADCHPVPHKDPKLRKGLSLSEDCLDNNIALEPYRFGFTSLDALKRWFSNMEQARGRVKRYLCIHVLQVPDESVVLGSFQCIYLTADSTLIETWEPFRVE